MSKALQEFDLALRGKKKRAKFLKDGKKKELTVGIISTSQSVSQSACGPGGNAPLPVRLPPALSEASDLYLLSFSVNFKQIKSRLETVDVSQRQSETSG